MSIFIWTSISENLSRDLFSSGMLIQVSLLMLNNFSGNICVAPLLFHRKIKSAYVDFRFLCPVFDFRNLETTKISLNF